MGKLRLMSKSVTILRTHMVNLNFEHNIDGREADCPPAG